jgi:uncharacterized membrane protein
LQISSVYKGKVILFDPQTLVLRTLLAAPYALLYSGAIITQNAPKNVFLPADLPNELQDPTSP